MKTRKPNRLKNYDYSQNGAYHLILCTVRKSKILSTIDDKFKIHLLPLGKIVDQTMNYYIENNIYNIPAYVIMPNHLHILLIVENFAQSDRKNETVFKFVSSLKRYTNKIAETHIWQRSFYDSIIKSENDFENTVKYIYENPIKWELDEYY